MNFVNNLDHIVKSFNEKKLSHAFLIETNNIEECLKDLKKVIKIINCEKKYSEDCSSCNLCYQIDKETLPSFVIIRPDGSSVKKEQIIELKEKMFTKPIYSRYNAYVIMNAEKLNNSSSNTMLKFIEEPEENIIGFFLTNNKENIIETIRSRCQLIIQNYHLVQEKIDDEKSALIEDFIRNFELDNKYALLYNKNIFMEKKYTRDETIEIFLEIFKIYNAIYKKNYDKISENYNFLYNLNNLELLNRLNAINKALDSFYKNGNINLILDTFVIEVR